MIREIRERLQELLRDVEEYERKETKKSDSRIEGLEGTIMERTFTGTFRGRLRDSFRGKLEELSEEGGGGSTD